MHAVDIAPTMIDRLRARAEAEGLTTLRAVVGDGTALDLDDDSFDVAVSLNGVSLFPDLTGGLSEMVRVTRPGGHVLVGTFGPIPNVEFVGFLFGALRTVAPERLSASDEPLPPFQLAAPVALQRTLERVGLRDATVDVVTWETTFDSVDRFLDAIMSSNLMPDSWRPACPRRSGTSSSRCSTACSVNVPVGRPARCCAAR